MAEQRFDKANNHFMTRTPFSGTIIKSIRRWRQRTLDCQVPMILHCYKIKEG